MAKRHQPGLRTQGEAKSSQGTQWTGQDAAEAQSKPGRRVDSEVSKKKIQLKKLYNKKIPNRQKQITNSIWTDGSSATMHKSKKYGTIGLHTYRRACPGHDLRIR
ncbi:hypothetical protein [Blackfly microvirus SF02]|uniref:Uncharacterized protein n=1 Tax=Blackfly microvirus SF02 TaxID=2576452 RepID=A0A4P8PJV8_9VIRU|nr:hypothetical protein [Blackfly microvirus SF02]